MNEWTCLAIVVATMALATTIVVMTWGKTPEGVKVVLDAFGDFIRKLITFWRP